MTTKTHEYWLMATATNDTQLSPPARRSFKVSKRRALPYLLSLPALLACIGILIPFVTAALYSLQRYPSQSQPWNTENTTGARTT